MVVGTDEAKTGNVTYLEGFMGYLTPKVTLNRLLDGNVKSVGQQNQ